MTVVIAVYEYSFQFTCSTIVGESFLLFVLFSLLFLCSLMIFILECPLWSVLPFKYGPSMWLRRRMLASKRLLSSTRNNNFAMPTLEKALLVDVSNVFLIKHNISLIEQVSTLQPASSGPKQGYSSWYWWFPSHHKTTRHLRSHQQYSFAWDHR